MATYDAFRRFLLADSSIAAVVGTRAYPIKLPQGATTPAIVITPVSVVRDGVLRGPAPYEVPRFQVDCWVEEQPGTSAFQRARELGALVLARLENYQGPMIDPSTSPDRSIPCWVAFDQGSARETFEGDIGGGFYRHSADYFVGHRT